MQVLTTAPSPHFPTGKLAAKHERDLLVGALPVGGAAEHERKGKERLTLDAIVAREYAERLAASSTASSTASATTGAATAGDASAAGGGAVAGASAGSAVPGGVGGAAPTVFDILFQSVWEETTSYPGTNPATALPIAPVSREVRSLVVPLQLPEPPEEAAKAEAAKAEAAKAVPKAPPSADTPAAAEAPAAAAAAASASDDVEPGSFVAALRHCVCRESSTRAWCAEMGKYRHARVSRSLIEAPNALWLHTSALPPSTMEAWEASHKGSPWLPSSFHLQVPTAARQTAAAAAAAAAAGAAPDPAAPLASAAPPRVSLQPFDVAGAAGGGSVRRYTLRALVSFTQSALPNASDGSGHLVLFFRVPTRPATLDELALELSKLSIARALRNVGDIAGAAAAPGTAADAALAAVAAAAAAAQSPPTGGLRWRWSHASRRERWVPLSMAPAVGMLGTTSSYALCRRRRYSLHCALAMEEALIASLI
jgi:hypothetical protein